jgi:hypothetical protein
MQTNEDEKPATAPPVPPQAGDGGTGAAMSAAAAKSRKQGWRGNETWVAAFAVGVVGIAGLTAAFMSRPDAPEAAPLADSTSAQKGVVTAPPLKAPMAAIAQQPQHSEAANATRAMGAAPPCRNCGVVQMVVAVHGYAQPRASGYQMHIRMDDGSTRMVEQRGALAAGSRVVVEGASVRPLSERAGQG